jgi:tetratricopeptide (TPR) repeat protein
VGDARPWLLAFIVAVLWTVHPLQTESVTYISQRAESLMGLFYLLTLYCFIRSSESSTPVFWQILSILACLLGVLSKENIATVPLMVLLYDRTFCAGTFAEAWRRRSRYYLGLAVPWLALARLMTGLNRRGAGFGEGVDWRSFAMTSCRSVVMYLKLALWPHPLVIDYGTQMIRDAAEAAPFALVVAALLGLVAIALRYRPVLGFAGAWFFVILAPSSSVVPVPGQPMAEHRMYLSLAAVIALVVTGFHALFGRRGLWAFAAVAAAFMWLTVERNRDYRSELDIWSDTVAKRPDNERAHNALGRALMDIPGRRPEAISEFEAALRIKPDYAEAHFNLGTALSQMPGRMAEAGSEFEAALRYKPDYAEAHDSLANVLAGIPGHLSEAIGEYEAALRYDPDLAEAHNNLGSALARFPERLPEAIVEYETAIRIKPDYAEAHFNLAIALSRASGGLTDAIAEYRAALSIRPDYPEALNNLGSALAGDPGQLPEAIGDYEAALRIRPDYAEAHNNLGSVLAGVPGRLPEAIGHFEEAVRIRPDFALAHFNLARALSETPGKLPAAIAELETALRIRPDFEPARSLLDRLRAAQ